MSECLCLSRVEVCVCKCKWLALVWFGLYWFGGAVFGPRFLQFFLLLHFLALVSTFYTVHNGIWWPIETSSHEVLRSTSRARLSVKGTKKKWKDWIKKQNMKRIEVNLDLLPSNLLAVHRSPIAYSISQSLTSRFVPNYYFCLFIQ